MRKPLGSIGVVVLVLAGPAWAEDSPRDLVEKAIKAHGGLDRLTKMRADWVRVKGVLLVNGKEQPFTGQTIVQLPDQFKSILEVSLDDRKVTVTQALDGDSAWVTIDGQPQVKIPAAALAEMKAIMHLDRIVRLVPLLTEKGYELMALGESKVNGRDVLGIKVLSRGHREVRLYFDKENGLLLKTEHLLDNSLNKEVRQEEYYGEFKNVAGYTRPTRLTVFRDGKKTMEAHMVEVKYYEKLDQTVFAKP